MKKDHVFTYQTRLEVSEEIAKALEKTAEYLSRVERCLFADYAKSKNIQDLKAEYLQKFGITARQFNAIRVQLEGKIQSIILLRDEHIQRLQSLIKKVKNKILRLEKKKESTRKKREQLQRLEKKLFGLINDKKQGKVRLCFGSQKLFHAQFHLSENGYNSHEEWKKDWHKSRNDSFFALGSKDETAGNQTCEATVCEDGTFTLKIRLPDALVEEHGKYLFIEKVHFAYGHEVILSALENCKKRHLLQKTKDPSYSFFGQAISYRFKLGDNHKWYVFASTAFEAPPISTHKERGAIGIDINIDHIALVETNDQGNPIHKESIPLNTHGKSTNQTEALIGDAVVKIVNHAKDKQKPLVIEELDFEKKKEELHEKTNSYARKLSSFVYHKIIEGIEARSYKNGVEVFSVDPAFTSVIGRVKYAVRYGLTVHESAAFCIARRGLGISEKLPCQLDRIPDGKGDYISLTLPERKRGKHKYSSWKQIHKKLKAELAAHFRAKKIRSLRLPKNRLM